MKYSGLILLLIIALSVYFSWDGASNKQYFPSNTGSSVAELQQLKSSTLVQTDEKLKAETVQQQIDRISTYKSVAEMNTDLIALAPVAPVIKKSTISLPSQRYAPYKTASVKRYKAYVVSMVFIAPNNRYAVIDNHFSRVGDVLPDGGKLMAIEDNYIEVKRDKKIQVYKVRS